MRFPRPRGTLPPGPVHPAPTEASARPGGREAPAGGGAGAGRGLWAPGGPGISGALWQGRWPLPLQGVTAGRLPSPPVPICPAERNQKKRPSGREQETHRVSPARAGRCHKDRLHPHQQRTAPDPAGAKRPPGVGRALAGGFGPPARQGSSWRAGKGDGLCHWGGASRNAPQRPSPGGNRNRTARSIRPRRSACRHEPCEAPWRSRTTSPPRSGSLPPG
jgi:hypothetical protein